MSHPLILIALAILMAAIYVVPVAIMYLPRRSDGTCRATRWSVAAHGEVN